MKTIVEILEEYNVELTLEGRILRAYCPFHEDTGRANFTVYPETNSWFCFAGCGGGDVVSFVSKIENITRAQAKLKLDDVNIELDELTLKIAELEGKRTETVSYNNEVNSLVSKWFYQVFQTHPERAADILRYMVDFDKAINVPISHSQMMQLVAKAKEQLGDIQ